MKVEKEGGDTEIKVYDKAQKKPETPSKTPDRNDRVLNELIVIQKKYQDAVFELQTAKDVIKSSELEKEKLIEENINLKQRLEGCEALIKSLQKEKLPAKEKNTAVANEVMKINDRKAGEKITQMVSNGNKKNDYGSPTVSKEKINVEKAEVHCNKPPKKTESKEDRKNNDTNVEINKNKSRSRKRNTTSSKNDDETSLGVLKKKIKTEDEQVGIENNSQQKKKSKVALKNNDAEIEDIKLPHKRRNTTVVSKKDDDGKTEIENDSQQKKESKVALKNNDAKTEDIKLPHKKQNTTVVSKKNQKKNQKKNDDSFEVEDILKHKLVKSKRYFLVRWKSYGPEDDSWEPEINLQCPTLLKKYIKRNNL